MIETIIVVALISLFQLLVKNRNNEKGSSATEKENNCRKHQVASIVGESRFVLGDAREKKTKTIELDSDTSGKFDIEVPLDYETEETVLLEEQEELESLGLQNDYSTNTTFDEMILVVNEVGNNKDETTPQTGKLLYENENTDWVEQLASSSENSAKRIASLIDLHLEKLVQSSSDVELDDSLMGFDIEHFIC